MILFKSRQRVLALSQTNSTAALSLVVGTLVTIWGLVLIVGTYTNWLNLIDPDIKNYAYLFFVALIVMGISIFNIGLKKNCAPKNPNDYYPGYLARKRTFNLIFGTIFMICFLSIFLYIGLEKTGFLIIGLVFLIITVIGVIFEIKNISKLFKKSKKFGPSKLIPLSTRVLRGDTASFRLMNVRAPEKLKNSEIILRNLMEKWERRDPDRRKEKSNSVTLKTFILGESKSVFDADKHELEFEILFPSVTTQSTDYKISNPIYWELEINNPSEQYYARFFIDVK